MAIRITTRRQTEIVRPITKSVIDHLNQCKSILGIGIGYDIPFTKLASVNVTNTNIVTTSYNVYRSDNKLGGERSFLFPRGDYDQTSGKSG